MKRSSNSEEIDRRVKNAKERIYSEFLKSNKYWWKEEDLHAYLYHLLIDEGIPSKLIHSEYQLIKGSGDKGRRERIGDLDLAILWPYSGDFNLYECKVMHAIEIKFPRKLEDSGKVTAYSSRRNFAKDLFRDYGKLCCADDLAENVIDDLRKHILFFQKLDRKFRERNRLFDEREPEELFKEPLEDYKKIQKLLKEKEENVRNLEVVNKRWRFENYGWYKFKKEKFDDIYFSYVEADSEEKHSPVLINWTGEPDILQI